MESRSTPKRPGIQSKAPFDPAGPGAQSQSCSSLAARTCGGPRGVRIGAENPGVTEAAAGGHDRAKDHPLPHAEGRYRDGVDLVHLPLPFCPPGLTH